MGVVGWLVLGLVAGAIARALYRGAEPSGLLGTLFVGVLGALLGGLVASAIGLARSDRSSVLARGSSPWAVPC